jgi:SH3 domain protein
MITMHNALKWLLAIMMTLPLVAFAETAYITEKLEIPLRSGESRDYRIIRYLQAGAQVEI